MFRTLRSDLVADMAQFLEAGQSVAALGEGLLSVSVRPNAFKLDSWSE